MKNINPVAPSDKFVETVLRLDSHLRCEETFFGISEGAIRVLRFSRYLTSPGRVLLFIPGWASTVFTWRYFIRRLTTDFEVLYLESREKSSSRLSPKSSFHMGALAQDISSYINHTLAGKHFALCGGSTGATLILEAWPQIIKEPECVVLILPNKLIPIPRLVLMTKVIPERWLTLLRPIAVHLIRNFRLNSREAAQNAGLFAALETASLAKLRSSGLALSDYRLDLLRCPRIDAPSLVVGASNDRFHRIADAREIYTALPKAEFRDVGSFTAAHSSAVAAEIADWIGGHYGRLSRLASTDG